MTAYEQTLDNSEKEKLGFNRTKPPAKPGSGRGSHLVQLFGGVGRKTGQKTHTESRSLKLLLMITLLNSECKRNAPCIMWN